MDSKSEPNTLGRVAPDDTRQLGPATLQWMAARPITTTRIKVTNARRPPYELVSVAGGWQHRKKAFGDIIHAAFGTAGKGTKELSQSEALVLMCIAYFQPITRGELSSFFAKDVSRDLIGVLRGQELIASGPRSPKPGAPYTYVTTKTFLSQLGLDTLRQLPDFEALEDPSGPGMVTTSDAPSRSGVIERLRPFSAQRSECPRRELYATSRWGAPILKN